MATNTYISTTESKKQLKGVKSVNLQISKEKRLEGYM